MYLLWNNQNNDYTDVDYTFSDELCEYERTETNSKSLLLIVNFI